MRVYLLGEKGRQERGHGETREVKMATMNGMLHENGPSPASALPEEVLRQIFELLPSSSLTACSRVAKLWNATASSFMYHTVVLRDMEQLEAFSRTLAGPKGKECGRYIRHFALVPSPELLPGWRGVKQDEPVPPYMVENYPELDTGRKESEWLVKVNDDDLAPIFNHATHLLLVHLSGCESLTDGTLYRIAETTDPILLHTLNVSLIRNLNDEVFHHMYITKGFRSLEHVDVSFCNTLTDKAILDLVEANATTLRSLRVNTIYALTDTSLKAVAQRCHKLQLLHMSRCWRVTNQTINLIPQNCPHLRYLAVSNLRDVTEQSLNPVVQTCKELLWIDVTECGIISIFRPMIFAAWKMKRQQAHLPEVQIVDGRTAALA